jgi:hypothetical protein
MATTKMNSNASTGGVSPDLTAQRNYVRRLHEEGFDFGLTIADAFVRGIRDIGYKSTATALDELIDNAIQAEAENLDVVLGYDPRSDAKPARLAVIDDGHGMDPDMIRLAVVWGGTHRENNRLGFGRYGYGLPSASISQGKQFTVYSRVTGGGWHQVTLDLDEISAGNYTMDGRIVVPEPTPAQLPAWLAPFIDDHYDGDLVQGTVVVIDKLDRLSWKTTAALETNLLQHFGVTYRNFLREINLWVNDKPVEPVDPLFLTPGYRFYDLNEVHAEALEPLTFDVKEDGGKQVLGTVKVRFSYMPPAFTKGGGGRGKTNARFAIMRDHNGIIVLRNGRQIDVLTRCPWTSFQNNDRYWGVEVDFPAAVDEEFSITTSKQQVVMSDRIWDLLEDAGVWRAIQQLRKRYDEDGKREASEAETDPDKKRPSEQAMEDAEKFKTKKPGFDPETRRQESQEAFQREVERRARESGMPPEDVERNLLLEIQGNPYKVMQESLPGAPFFRVEQIGGQRVLHLNTAHRFFTDVYAGPASTPRLRASMEVLLFVLGECELDATEDRRLFYQTERGEWSSRLMVALDRLSTLVSEPTPSEPEDLVESITVGAE